MQKIKSIFIAIWILIFSNSLFASVGEKELLDMSKTYGFYLGQSYSLNHIEKKFPQLKQQVYLASYEFDSKYKKSIDNIEMMLKDVTKKEWANFQETIQSAIYQKLNPSDLTLSESLNFLTTVKSRAKGELESPILETLLSYHPTYQKYPEKEFLDGYFYRYKSDGNPKSKGVNFTIKVPESWLSKEAERPNIVRKFISQNGSNPNMIMAIVYDIPQNITKINKEDLKYLCNDIPHGSILRSCDKIVIENLPAIRQKMKMKMQRIDKVVDIEIVQYSIFFKNKVISLQGHIGNFENLSEKELLKRFKQYEPLFELVANSLVLEDMYK